MENVENLMKIDISKPAISKEDIANRRARLNNSIASLEKRSRRSFLIACLPIPLAIAISVMLITLFPFMSLVFAVVFGLMIIFALTFSFNFFALMYALGLASFMGLGVENQGISVDGTLAIVSLFFLATYTTVSLIIVSFTFDDGVEDNLRELYGFTESDDEDCLNIIKWIELSEIKAFRCSVQNQGRRFIKAEVEAMKEFYESLDKRLSNDKKHTEIKAACKKVYLGGLIEEGSLK